MNPSFTPRPAFGSRGQTFALRALGIAAACVLETGCDRADTPRPVENLASALTVTRAFGLDENASVINVSPEAFRDPAGGFLVADSREAQIRRYSGDGKLMWHAGRRGGGPHGEFQAPTAVVRLPSGEVAVFDRSERLVVFDSVGGAVLRTFRTPLPVRVRRGRAERFQPARGRDRRRDRREGPRLHVIDPATGLIRTQFFTPFAGSPYPAAATIAGWTRKSPCAATPSPPRSR